MNSSSSYTPSCAQPMSSAELRTWTIGAIVVVIILVGINWWHRAAPSAPVFTNF